MTIAPFLGLTRGGSGSGTCAPAPNPVAISQHNGSKFRTFFSGERGLLGSRGEPALLGSRKGAGQMTVLAMHTEPKVASAASIEARDANTRSQLPYKVVPDKEGTQWESEADKVHVGIRAQECLLQDPKERESQSEASRLHGKKRARKQEGSRSRISAERTVS
jgi:hypothetical protein